MVSTSLAGTEDVLTALRANLEGAFTFAAQIYAKMADFPLFSSNVAVVSMIPSTTNTAFILSPDQSAVPNTY